MSKKNRNARKQYFGRHPQPPAALTKPNVVDSLLDAMRDGNEYGSIVDLRPRDGEIVPDLRRALAEIEAIRKRRCICYVANVIKEVPDTAIVAADHLPFNEMVEKIVQFADGIDVFVVTPGGTAEQVTLFVDSLRGKFPDSVEFILPYKSMSAGTLWALSGERIWMDRRACIGPVDPQVPSSDGRLVPAQSILTLLEKIQTEGDAALKNKQNPPWAYVRLLDKMDHRQLGAAISSTRYIEEIAAKYLRDYKFKTWREHSSNGQPVTPEEREARAKEVAALICSHEKWKAHGHAINRDTAFAELKVKVDNIEAVDGLERAVRRLWALFYYIFDKSAATKIMISQEYSYIRHVVAQQVQQGASK
jgi:hypothetical protein